MTEAQSTRLFLRQWRLAYPTGLAIKLNDRSTAGLPDAVLIHKGQHRWVEFKREGEPLRPLQTTFLKLLRRSGARTAEAWFHPRRLVTLHLDGSPPAKTSWTDAVRRLA